MAKLTNEIIDGRLIGRNIKIDGRKYKDDKLEIYIINMIKKIKLCNMCLRKS